MRTLNEALIGILFFVSCNTINTDTITGETAVENVLKDTSVDKSRNFVLRLNPADSSKYVFKAQNETLYILEYDGKEVKSSNTSNVQYHYIVHKDTAGGFYMDVVFDSIKVITIKDHVIVESDAANAALTINPLDRMLNILKSQPLKVKVNQSGAVESIKGYEELGQQFLSKFDENDIYAKTVAREQWDKIVANGLVKGQMNQLFKSLPDSAIYRGFTWKSKEKLDGEMPLNVEAVFKVKSIEPDGLATVVLKADLKSPENETFDIAGQRGITAKLSGQRNGILYINTKTGIINKSEYISNINGTILAFGNFVPITIKNKISLKQSK